MTTFAKIKGRARNLLKGSSKRGPNSGRIITETREKDVGAGAETSRIATPKVLRKGGKVSFPPNLVMMSKTKENNGKRIWRVFQIPIAPTTKAYTNTIRNMTTKGKGRSTPKAR